MQSAIPEAHGGYGDVRSAITSALVLEELGAGDLSIALHVLAPRLIAFPVLELGGEEQKKQVLPAYAGADYVAGTAAVMEPDFRYEIGELATTAVRSHDEWVLNGEKCDVRSPRGAPPPRLRAGRRRPGCVHRPAGHARPGDRRAREEHGVEGARDVWPPTRELPRPPFGAARRRPRADAQPLARRPRVARGRRGARRLRVTRATMRRNRRAFGVAIGQKQAIAFMLAEMAIEIDAERLLTRGSGVEDRPRRRCDARGCLRQNYAANMAAQGDRQRGAESRRSRLLPDHMVELWLRNGRGFGTFDGIAMA